MADLSPKEHMSISAKLDILDKISDKVNKKFGKCIMGRIGNAPEIMERLTIKYIPTPSLELNEAVGGGFPRRRCTIIAGNPDSGKTSIVLETIGLNMKNDPNFCAIWLESESSLEKNYIINTFKIDPERFFFIEVNASVGTEETLDILYSILQTGVADICAINSLKCLVPTKEQESSLKDITIALQARQNARLTKKFLALVAEYETAFILITHLTTDINAGAMSRDPMIVAGGHAIKYWSSLTLDLRKRSILESDPIGKDEGVKIGVHVLKNHCTPDKFPYVKFAYYAIFGQGIEQYLSTLDKACKQGVLDAKGAWIYWTNKETGEIKEKWNGKANYRTFMIEHPEIFQELKHELYPDIEKMSDEEIQSVKELEEAIDNNILYDETNPLKKKKTPKKSSSKNNNIAVAKEDNKTVA